MGLIHLGFLAAAAAVAVPILIHLLLRPRARRVEIGTLRFLKQALRDNTRRRKIRRWLLLLLRSLAVLLLALLFARPYLSIAGTEGRDHEALLLIDQSASMGVTHNGRTLFALGQEAAQKVLKELPAETATHLAYFDDRGVYPASEARIDSARQPGYAGTDFGQALRWARDLLVLSPRPQKRVFIITDLQRCGLHRSQCEGFPADVPVELIEVGKPLVTNLAVETVEVTQTEIRPPEPVVITASIFNAGPFPARNLPVRLVLEGAGPKLEQVQTISVAAASRQPARFSVLLSKPGLYSGYVEVVGDDEFKLDNRGWLAFEARTPDRLLLVDGEPGATIYGNETYYLEAALRLRLPGKGPPLTPYEPERLAWIEGANLPGLTKYAVVVLCNVAKLAEPDVSRLRRFVSEGGRLLVFTGKQVLPSSYEPLHQVGLLPASVEGSTERGLFRFDTWDKEHPIFRPLSDPQQGDLRRIVVRQITRLKPAPGAKILASTQTGNPLVVEGKLDRGTVLLVATSADRDWTDWPQTRLYVPLIHQIFGYLTDRLPENQRIRLESAGPGRDNPPGVSQKGQQVFVYNLDPKESEIDRASAEQFRQAFHLFDLKTSDKRQSADASAKVPPSSQRPDEIWTYIAWALLLVLLAEVFVANRTHA